MQPIADGGSICIEFDHRPDDVVALRRFYLVEYTNGRQRRQNYVWGALCLAALAIGIATASLDWNYDWEKNIALPLLFTPPVLLVTFGVVAYLIYRESTTALSKQVERQTTMQRGPTERYGRRQITFDRTGYRLTGDGHEHYLAWRLLPAILRDFDHVYLCHRASREELLAIIVPGRAFPSQACFDEFYAEIMGIWRAARVEDVLNEVAHRKASRSTSD